MGRNLWAFLAGGLFGMGLVVSDMVNTRKVQGWLDVFGDWDPTLAFVLGGAILPMAIAWRIARGRERSLLGSPIPQPSPPVIDRNLLGGSLLFGMGWGLAGLCPGPSIAALSFGGVGGVTFVLAMVAGMMVAPALRSRIDRIAAPA